MIALMIVLIVVIVAIVAVAIVGLRMFSIERITTTIDPKTGKRIVVDDDDDDDDDEDDEDSEGDEEDAATEETGEMVNLFDYFDEENPDGQSADKRDAGHPDDAYTQLDKLTEFKTGRRFLLDCKKSLEAAKEDSHVFCCCSFDFDRFSYINSLKGAATGDYVLTNASQQIRRIFPEGATATRVSADHFAVVFPLVDLNLFEEYYDQLKRMCDKIKNDIAAKTGLRVCVAFAATDNDASYDVNVLMTRANIARHCAKVTKVEKFEMYEDSMIQTNFYGDSMMDNYGECQYGDDFAIYFESQIDLVNDKICGVDTLVRWSCDDKSTEPITQETGHIPTNNDKVFYHVCRAVSRWRKAGREIVSVFIDIPVTCLFKTDIDEFISKCLNEFQIEPASIVLKIDVCAVRIDWSSCSKQFKKFHEMGLKICICGMDTGYSSLEFLQGLPIDFLKLHKSFAHGVEKVVEQQDKCRRIIERAAGIGARVIFEGVDTTDQVQMLRQLNCKTVQGRYSGKPGTPEDLLRDLPEHVERRMNDQTVILDEAQLAKGDWTL